MSTLYTRTVNLKDSLTDDEVIDILRFSLEEVVPAIRKVPGIRSVKFYSGAGALWADLSVLAEMDDASANERLLVDAEVRKFLGRLYGALDLNTAGQSFRREVPPELIKALSGRQ